MRDRKGSEHDKEATALGRGDSQAANDLITESWTGVEAVEWHAPDLEAAYADPQAFGYGKLGILELALQQNATQAAVVKDADDQTLLTLALIENLQRNDLSPIDEAQGYQRLIEQFRLPQADVARMVGRNRSTVANLLRLLKLPAPVRAMVHEGRLSEGHARALLALESERDVIALADEAVRDAMSVREVEARVRGEDAPAAIVPGAVSRQAKAKPRTLQVSADVRRVEDALRKRLGTDVRVTQKRKGRGIVAVSYYSNDDLARLLELILGQPFDG